MKTPISIDKKRHSKNLQNVTISDFFCDVLFSILFQSSGSDSEVNSISGDDNA